MEGHLGGHLISPEVAQQLESPAIEPQHLLICCGKPLPRNWWLLF
jgi:surfactin synthase thioesterase subunit